MTLANLVRYIHWFFIAIVLFAWISPWRPLLIFHFFFIPALILHWRLNHDRCVLTDLEAKLRESEVPTRMSLTPEGEPEKEPQFIKSSIENCLGRKLSETFMKRLTYGVMALVWSVSLTRLIADS